MKDFAGNELEVGDKVLICLPYYKHLVWGEVERFTDRMIICSYHRSSGRRDTVPRHPNQVVLPMTERLKHEIEQDVLFNKR